MNKFSLVTIYVLGFIVFINVMNIIGIDNFLSNNLNETKDNFMTNKEDKSSHQVESRTAIIAEDAKKPLKLSKEEIGRHTWALLHSVAATFPSIPTSEDKQSLEQFIEGLSKVYPCKICSKHFQQMLKDFPIKHNTREEFVYYLCDLHNKVNERLGKTIYDCKKAFDIWGGDCGCDVVE